MIGNAGALALGNKEPTAVNRTLSNKAGSFMTFTRKRFSIMFAS
jgi:hypothetical protein